MSAMNTCGTCKYLGKALTRFDVDYNTVEPVYYQCDLIKHTGGSDYEMNQSGTIAGVIDGSGYFAALCVKNEFGCNQWTERGPDQPE